MTEKIKQTDKFNLDGLGAKRVVKKSLGLRAWQKILIALMGGAALAFSNPGFGYWWLAWFMVAPLLVTLSFCHRNLEPLLVGFSFAFMYHLVSLHSYLLIADSSKQMVIIIWFLQAFMLSLPTMGFAWLMSFLPLRPGYIPYFERPFFAYLIATPLLWVFLHWGLSIAHPLANIWKLAPFPPLPIDSLAYSQYSLLPILQLLKYIGPSGLEFLLILVNSAIAAFIVEIIKTNEGPVVRVDAISPRAGSLLDLFGALVLVGALYYFGQGKIDDSVKQSKEYSLYDKSRELTQPILPVGIVASHGEPAIKSAGSTIEKQLAIIIFPEAKNEISVDQINALMTPIRNIVRQNRNAAFLSFAFSEKQDVMRHNLIVSSDNTVNIKQSIYYSPGLILANDLLPNNSQKAMVLLSSMPIFSREWLFKLDKEDLSSWYCLGMPKTTWGKVGLLSGADIEDFRLVANEVRRGASLIVSSINLSWINSRFFYKQLLAAAIFRAIENDRYVLLCGNDGVMAIIEPSGAVQSLFLPSQISEQAPQQNKDSELLLGTVQFLWSKTPFTKTWWL